jgi:hypothetical protein
MNQQSELEMQILFDMYVSTYLSAGESVWFKTPEQLEVYSRGYQKHYDDGTLAWFILYQPFPQANKISLLVHDGSIHAKQDMFDNLAQLLVKKGNIMEASGAPAHILTQRYRLLPMQNQSDIEFALDVAAKEYKILMNPAYTPFATTDKLKSFVYTRLSGGYANRESLFGRICNNLKQQWRNAYQTNHKCDRECLYEDDDM